MIVPELAPNRKVHLTEEQFSVADAALQLIETSDERKGVVPLPDGALDVDMSTPGARMTTQVHHQTNRRSGDAYRSFRGQRIDGEQAGGGVSVELKERHIVARAISRLLRRKPQPYMARFYDDTDPNEKFRFFPDV